MKLVFLAINSNKYQSDHQISITLSLSLSLDAASRMNRLLVPVSTDVHPDGEVGVSYIHWKPTKQISKIPIILVHGFDSSCLEYRRLGPKLVAQGIDTYAVDILGWGFSDLKGRYLWSCLFLNGRQTATKPPKCAQRCPSLKFLALYMLDRCHKLFGFSESGSTQFFHQQGHWWQCILHCWCQPRRSSCNRSGRSK